MDTKDDSDQEHGCASAPAIFVTTPLSPSDWERYFDLRWRVLRAPWQQPVGSERDDLERDAIHIIVCAPERKPLGIGRLHLNSTDEAQVRYMAVEPASRGLGIGRIVLAELERGAIAVGAKRIVLNSRDTAVAFYKKQGYRVTGAGELLFGEIPHVKMQKDLRG